MSDLFSPRFAPPPPSPPPAPPLPPLRYVNRATNALARFAQPFIGTARPASAQTHRSENSVRRISPAAIPNFTSPLSSQSTTHKTGIPIAAVDISPQRTHAVVAGREIFKTIRVAEATCAEELNLRASIIAHASTHHSGFAGQSSRLKDNLAAVDVKWSHGQYSSCIATAAANGRVQLYDIHRAGVELASLHEHHRQVHKLAFNPHQGAYLLSASQDATVRLWDLRVVVGGRSVMSFRSARQYVTNAEGVRDIKWSPSEGTEFACGTDAGAIQRWDFRRESAPLLKVMAHQSGCHAVDWHPDGRYLVSAGSDKSVRVWDFSREDRKQNPSWTIRAPHPVLQVRWRPAEWMMNPHGQSAWETAQLVTSYSHQEPRVHLWHLRRPHVPFKEIDQYNSSPTDLLWHSPDLLWTVGLEGIFTQTDVHFAMEPAARRNVRCFDLAPDGEITFFTRRGVRPGLSLGPGPGFGVSAHSGPSKASSGEKLSGSRSTTDDDVNASYLGAPLKTRQSRAWSAKSSKSAGNTPPSEQFEVVVRKLDEILNKRAPFKPAQTGGQGHLCTGPGANSFARLASGYCLESQAAAHEGSEHWIRDVASEMEANACLAEDQGLYRIAQTWRVLGQALVKELHENLERETQRVRAPEMRDRERQRVPAREVHETERRQHHAHEVMERTRQHAQAQEVPERQRRPVRTRDTAMGDESLRAPASGSWEAEQDPASPDLPRVQARAEAASEEPITTDQVARYDFAISAAAHHEQNASSNVSRDRLDPPASPLREHGLVTLPQPGGRSSPPGSDILTPSTSLRLRDPASSSGLYNHVSPVSDQASVARAPPAPNPPTPSPLAPHQDVSLPRTRLKHLAATQSSTDSALKSPFGTAKLLERVMDYYLIEQSDVLTPSALFLFLRPYCPAIDLDHHRVSAMLRTLHDQLMQHSLFVEATWLRKFCYGDYTAAFEFTQEDVDIKFGCTDCRTLLDPVWYPGLGGTTAWMCRKCHQTPVPCALCCSSQGNRWWAWCQGCGHGGHASCLTEWWQDAQSEGGCPTEGCLHDCAQPRTKRTRKEEPISAMKDRGRPPVRGDDWVVGESKAVERLRGGLASGPKPEKRVKVVTPGEEEE